MAWSLISSDFIQYQANAAGASASGYYLKCYASGTTTPINVALDSAGSTLVAKVELDTEGFAQNASGGSTAVYVDQAYRLVLYANATDADANTFGNALQDIDGLAPASAASDLSGSTGSSLVGYIQGATGSVSTTVQTKLREFVSVKDFGATGDGATDDTTAIQAALDAVKAGGTLWFPPGDYFITAPVIPQYSGESPTARAALAEAGSATAGFIGDITIWGHGAKIVTTDATFTKSPYSAAMAFVATERVRVYGLIFESDHYNQTTGWMDSTNYLNLTEPTPKGSWGLLFVNFLDVKVVDCEFKHCNVGLVLTDDRVSSPTTTDAMRSYRSQVTGCRIFNCWTGLSMTYGATEEFIINNNHFEYTFIKLVQETDQGRSLHFKDNTCRDISGIVFNANDSYISGNTFNNLLGGISLQPQGGGNPDATYDYNLVNLYITDNIVYSDHNTTLVTGTAQPEAFITINASATLTASQTVVVKGLHISNNNVDLWPTGSSSTGAFVGRTGNADISFSDVFIKGNVVKFNNTSAVFVALAPSGVSTNTFYSGNIEVISNSFTRTANSGNIEFQFHANTYAEDIVIEFSNNYVDTQGNNRQVSVRNAGMLVSRDNKFIMTNFASSTTSVYYTMNVPLINIIENDIKIGSAASEGYVLYFDGETASTYSTDLDQAVVRVNNNRATNLQFAFNSPLTFPASAEGLYEIVGNVSAGGFGTDPHPTITGFITYNVTNPRITTTAPPAVSVIPSWYVVWSGDDTTGQPTGWKYNGAAWISLGTNP